MPDGQSIIYSRNAFDPKGTTGLGTLEVVDVMTGDIQVLLGPESTHAFAGVRPAPDGSAVVVEVVDKAAPDPYAEVTAVTLSIVDLSASAPVVTGITDPDVFAATADWSPDGTRIAYSALASPGDPSPDLFTIAPDGTEMTQVTQLAAEGAAQPIPRSPPTAPSWCSLPTSGRARADWPRSTSTAPTSDPPQATGTARATTRESGQSAAPPAPSLEWFESLAQNGLPSQLAGATTLEGAQANCAQPPLTGGPVTVTQYLLDGLDHNYACP